MRTSISFPRRIRVRLFRTLAVAGVVGALVLPGAAAQATTLPEDRSTPPPNVTFPVDLSANPVDARTYVADRHLGTDIKAACGTVVRAATPGTVRIRTDATWAGKAWVKVYTSKYRLTTYYAYLGRIDVSDDQIVQAGQPLGVVGDAGEATRCQLGFQVRNDAGRTVYNPSKFLDTYVGQKVPVTTLFGNAGFRLATFNVLGASHTKPGGDAASRYPGYEKRLPRAIKVLDDNAVDVVGLQEFQKPQHEMFQNLAGDRYGVYPAKRDVDTENSIAWRLSSFELVEAHRFDVTYFNGSIRKMPYILLREKSTGYTAWFINVHNPANTRTYTHQEKYRAMAIEAERNLVIQLRGTGRPVFLTGDLNDREKAFCPLTAGKLMLAPQSIPSMTCAPPAKLWIDWIFGAGQTRFMTYSVDWTVKDRNISDHPLVLSQTHLAE
jgi:endonuclease/exonuclease/phosphatase family metal-dependent hydrolase